MALNSKREEYKSYNDRFDPDAFLRDYSKPGTKVLADFALQHMARVYKLLSEESGEREDGLKLLDYGCGPVIVNVISAAGVVSEIVLAEYTQRNREAIQQWLDRDPSAFDWSPYFKYVVQTLEGKDDQEVVKREERLRSIIKAVVPCDITQDKPIEEWYEGPYDIVSCLLCIESAIKNLEQYSDSLRKLASLLKSGGTFLLYYAERERGNQEDLGWYMVGTEKYHDVRLTREFVLTSLEKCGFCVISVDHLPDTPNSPVGDTTGFVYVHAKKA